MDLLIAAIGHAHSTRLYTRNAEDFDGFDDLVEVVTVCPWTTGSVIRRPASSSTKTR